MKKSYLWLAVLASTFMPLAVQAQPGGGRGGWGGGPGGPGGPGFGRGFRSSPKSQLTRLVNQVGRLERSSTPLSAAQARSIFGILNPWTTKATLTDAQATTLVNRVNGVLTASQKKTLETMRPGRDGRGGRDGRPGGRDGDRDGRPGGRDGGREGRREGGFGGPGGRRGGWGGGPGGPGGGQRPTEAQMKQMQNFLATYNPLYPPTKYKQINGLPERFREGMTERYKRQQSVLSQLSQRGKKAR